VSRGERSAWRRFLILLALLLVLVVGLFVVSPWPSVLLIRMVFDRGAAQFSQDLEKHIPTGVVEYLGEVYDVADSDGLLDLYLPPPAMRDSNNGSPPLVVWVHGGGAISGSRADIGNYARVLAGYGFAVASVDYTVAPEAQYPTPVRQVNDALAYLASNASRLGFEPDRFVLAGDSAGAHIVAQVANLTVSPDYAQLLGIAPTLKPGQLRALVLFCGPYIMRSSEIGGLGGAFMYTVLWSYSGKRDFESDPYFATANVIEHLTNDFPPAFISAGNADPLLPHSEQLASKLEALGTPVEPLFFAVDHQPPLPHEYQFNLDSEAGQLALSEMLTFVRKHTR